MSSVSTQSRLTSPRAVMRFLRTLLLTWIEAGGRLGSVGGDQCNFVCYSIQPRSLNTGAFPSKSTNGPQCADGENLNLIFLLTSGMTVFA